MDGTLTSNIILDQSGLENNNNEGAPQISRTGATLSDAVLDTTFLEVGFYPSIDDIVSIF